MAHFNPGLSVPPLLPDDRIEDWEPLFRASVGHLTAQGEEGIKTAIGLFATPRGHFEMLVMPFGLCNSQSTYQRIMDIALRRATNTESYVDDLCTHSRGFELHLRDLHTTLECLRDAKIQLRIDKCRFGYQEGEFLGQVISANGRKPAPALVDRIAKFPPPKSVKEMQRFLGLANYYRSLIPKFAEIAEPLNRLTRKCQPWKWGHSAQSSFERLRSVLTTNPVLLRFPCWDLPFFIEADASDHAIVAVLSQSDQHGNLRPIAYFSSSLDAIQRRYCAGQREAWALVAATRKWHDYVKAAKHTYLVTDHNPLAWLRRQRDPRHTYARWLLELESIPYEIVYRKGAENTVADCLSRDPTAIFDTHINDDELFFEDHVYPIDSKDSWLGRMIQAQNSDPAISQALEELRHNGTLKTGQFKNYDNMKIDAGLLYRGHKLAVPKSMRRPVVELVHNQTHPGIRRTTELVKRNYFWRSMGRDVEQLCNECIVCHRNKPCKRPKERLQPYVVGEAAVGNAVAMDVATLPWSDGQYRYFLLIVDIFTRYVELVPMQEQKAVNIGDSFMSCWVYRHGLPRILISDGGRNVNGDLIRHMCMDLGIEKRNSSPYHPEGNGMAERMIGTVKQIMRCLLEERQLPKSGWPSLLPEVQFTCNYLRNQSTGLSPHQLVFGRILRGPLEALLKDSPKESISPNYQKGV